jgi:tRNA nucleotidyltransferase/poly(A) polymerase
MIDERIGNTIRKDKYNALIFDNDRRREVYLVGGYLRDALRGVHSHDRDYIVRGNVLSFVREKQKATGGTIIEFRHRDTIRLVLRNGHSFDFSKLQGSLEDNLSKRDFTINALAWSPGRGFVDLFNASGDIDKRVVRCISRKNMTADPLRMLRAYRFAAELDCNIDSITRQVIKRNCMKILSSSAERITLEMFHLLNTAHAARHLKMALEDGLLNVLMSNKINIIQGNIKVLHSFEKRILYLLSPFIKAQLQELFSQNLTRKGMLSLYILLRGCFEVIRNHLTPSNKIIDRLHVISEGISAMGKIRKVSIDRLFWIFKNAQDATVDILILRNKLDLLDELERFRAIWRRGLLSSEQVMEISGIKPGADLGKLILALKKTQFERRLTTRNEAIEFINNCKK